MPCNVASIYVAITLREMKRMSADRRADRFQLPTMHIHVVLITWSVMATFAYLAISAFGLATTKVSSRAETAFNSSAEFG